MIFPRALSVAERAHRAGWEQDYRAGANTGGKPTLSIPRRWRKTGCASPISRGSVNCQSGQGGVARLPVPGARVAGGKLEANIALPGLGIEYSTDGGKQWQRYDASQACCVR